MIVVESRLKELFDTLPPVQIPDAQDNPVDYNVTFDWGSIEDLNLLIKQGDYYPLLWLETGFTELYNTQEGEVDVSLAFVIATSGLNSSLLNQQRLKSTFDLVLFPVLDNVRKAFERSNITLLVDKQFTIQKFYNWSAAEQLETTQIWDALRFEVTLKINGDCLRTPNYG